MSEENKYKGIFWIVYTLLLIILVAYNLYSGLTVKRIGIPGIFDLEFGKVETKLPYDVPPKSKSLDVPPGEISGIIEELKRELEKNKNDQIRARQEVERIRPFLETDRDAWQALENQERWLEELAMNKQNIENELKSLREHR